MTNKTLKEEAVDRLYREILPMVEKCSSNEEFAEIIYTLSPQAQQDWNFIDQLDKTIFLSIVKTIMEERYGKPNP